MVHFDFVITNPEPETITFGNTEKSVTIDISFIPSSVGFQIKQKIQSVTDGFYSPQLFADIICLFTKEVTADWIVEHCEYGVLDQIVARILSKAFGRKSATKN